MNLLRNGKKLTSNAGAGIKNTLIKILSDKDFNYPSSVTNYENEYEHINGCICIENGMSVDYGFELKDIVDFLNSIPKQKFMP